MIDTEKQDNLLKQVPEDIFSDEFRIWQQEFFAVASDSDIGRDAALLGRPSVGQSLADSIAGHPRVKGSRDPIFGKRWADSEPAVA